LSPVELELKKSATQNRAARQGLPQPEIAQANRDEVLDVNARC
jgi:hypothetical protein